MSPEVSSTSAPLLPQPPEGLLLPDGAVNEDAAERFHEFVHPHHHPEETLVDPDACDNDEDRELQLRRGLPWWKRPSPWWLLAMLPISSIAMSATIAPRVEIYTSLACAKHKPEIFDTLNYVSVIPSTHSILGSSFSANGSHVISVPNGRLSSDRNAPTRKPSNSCASDPVVQAAVAKLAAVMTACMGVLGCITTGWWGSLSDRNGRVRVMGICVLGLLFTDANFILVYHFSQKLPGGYWFLLVGPLIEGSLGGLPTAAAASHAYMADATPAATRSRVFSMSLGFLFTGFALGPTLGGILIRVTHQTISVFYVATLVHLLYAFMIWFVVPESVSTKKMQLSKEKYHEQVLNSQRNVGILMQMKRWFSFLSPLSVFTPELVPANKDPLKTRRDWNLTLVALSYATTISIMGSYTYKFQYAASTFGWNSETLGYWLSLVGAARALHLAVILPLCIKLFKAKPKLSNDRAESLEVDPIVPSASTSGTARARSSSHSPARLTEPHSSAFDLGLARISLFVEVIAYSAMAFSTHPIMFTLFGMFGSLGSGFSPAVQSVALELYTRRGGNETGRLFGAMSVIQALSSQIIGPAVYGLIYVSTVATVPRAIFFVSVAAVAISLAFLSLVRLPDQQGMRGISRHEDDPTEPLLARESTLIDIDAEEAQDRRRKPIRAEV